MKEVREIKFSRLKHAYVMVKFFLEDETAAEIISLKTKLADDLGLYGDDNYFLLVKFTKNFKLDFSNFDYDNHFHFESDLFDSSAALYNLSVILIYILLIALQLMTFNKVIIKKPSFFKPNRKVLDLTFRELLICYIEGRYINGKDIKYSLLSNL